MVVDDEDGEETDSIVIDTSDAASIDAEQHVEEAAELYAQKYMNEQKKGHIDYDKYHFSVA